MEDFFAGRSILLVLTVIISTITAQCSFEAGSVKASWFVEGKTITVTLVNSNLSDNEYTAIAWGTSMDSLDFVMFKLMGGTASFSTGHTTGYQPPGLDANAGSGLQVKKMAYSNGSNLTATFSRPLSMKSPRKSALEGCVTWNLLKSGPLHSANDVGMHSETPTQKKICNVQNCKKPK